jgi:hypothetical protein
MPRQFRKTKPLIYVFCEGESEQAYTDFIRKKFEDVAVIKRPSATGLFEEAKSKFKKDPKYRDNAEVTDEIWFFFDVEVDDISKWDKRIKIINQLRKLRKKGGIKVRLLMTSGCIEYWLMLHYKMFTPPVQTVADKERILNDLIAKEPTYAKGNKAAIAKIAENYPAAVTNAGKTLQKLLSEGLPEMEDTDLRNHWLCTNCKTFSTVYEAINFLETLK